MTTDSEETFATPEGDEVFQLDDPMPSIPVEVKGIASVKVVGGRVTTFRTFSLSATSPQRIADNDPRRTAITIISIDQDIRIGHTQSDAGNSGGTRIPVGVPLALATSDEIWAACAVAGQTTEVSVLGEQWAR